MAEDSPEEKKRKDDLLNKLLNKQSIIVSFSVKPTDEDAVRALCKFNEVSRRETGSRGRSAVFVKAMTEYNLRHDAGNPQLKMTTYMDPSAPSPMRVLCWTHLAGATNEGQVYCRKHGGTWIQGLKCHSCPNNQLRKKSHME